MNKIMNFYKHHDMADSERRQARAVFIDIIGDKSAQVELCKYLTTLKNKAGRYGSINYAIYQRKLEHLRMICEPMHILKNDAGWCMGWVGVVVVDGKYKWLEVPTTKVDKVNPETEKRINVATTTTKS